MERGDQSFLVGGEGANSPLIRVALPLNPVQDKLPEDFDDSGNAESAPWGMPSEVPTAAFGVPTMAIAGLGIGIVAALVIAVVALRRRW